MGSTGTYRVFTEFSPFFYEIHQTETSSNGFLPSFDRVRHGSVYRVLLGFNEIDRVSTEFYRVLPSFSRLGWGSTGDYWVFFTEFSRID